jgi:hypothetical protein
MTSKFEREFETRLSRTLIEKIKETYGDNVWVYTVLDDEKLGKPHFLLCFFGHFVGVRVKARGHLLKKGELDPKYLDNDLKVSARKYIKQINRAQGSAFVGRYIDDAMRKLEKIYHSIKLFKK